MKPINPTLLIVESNSTDTELMIRAFRQNGATHPIHSVQSSEQAVAYLKGEKQYSDRSHFSYPSFIMVDLKMSSGDGFSVLEHLKSTPEWAIIPTVVFSASSDPDDIKKSYMLGAGSYLVKPTDYDQLRRLLKIFHDYWSECEVPEIDFTGKRLRTYSEGKLGERFPQSD
jgi:CheY-like chemotaxis protein